MIILFQVRLSRGSGDVTTAARAFRRSGVLIAIALVGYAAASGANAVATSIVLVLGIIVHTLGELYSSGASWGIDFGMAREDLQGQYQGAFSLGRGLSGILGPLIVISIAASSTQVGWIVLAVMFTLVGTLTCRSSMVTRRRTNARPHCRNAAAVSVVSCAALPPLDPLDIGGTYCTWPTCRPSDVPTELDGTEPCDRDGLITDREGRSPVTGHRYRRPSREPCR